MQQKQLITGHPFTITETTYIKEQLDVPSYAVMVTGGFDYHHETQRTQLSFLIEYCKGVFGAPSHYSFAGFEKGRKQEVPAFPPMALHTFYEDTWRPELRHNRERHAAMLVDAVPQLVAYFRIMLPDQPAWSPLYDHAE